MNGLSAAVTPVVEAIAHGRAGEVVAMGRPDRALAEYVPT